MTARRDLPRKTWQWYHDVDLWFGAQLLSCVVVAAAILVSITEIAGGSR